MYKPAAFKVSKCFASSSLRLPLTAVALVLSLAACTAGRPPQSYLPSGNSLVRGEQITVGRGETIYAVAQKHGVNMREIIVLNDLNAPFSLRTGQKLYLPNKDRYAAPVPQAAPLDPIDKGYMGPSREGRVVSTSSAVTAVQLEPPASSAPKVAPAYEPLTVTDTPVPPASDTPTLDAAAKTTNFSTQKASRPTTQVQDMDVKELGLPSFESKAEQAAPAPAPEAAPAPATVISSDTVPSFVWPVRGTIISAFGPKGKGRDNDGINIAAPKGAPVKAAEGGIVAYAGNEMKGFGNLVLIRHEGGWVTAYSHMDRVVVARDAIVAKGDMIGAVGTTGGVTTPQLHFEARRDGKPTDPELVLK